MTLMEDRFKKLNIAPEDQIEIKKLIEDPESEVDVMTSIDYWLDCLKPKEN